MNIKELVDSAYDPKNEDVDFVTSAREVGSAIADIPKQTAAALVKLTKGGHYDPRDQGLATRLIESAEQDVQEKMSQPGAERRVINLPGETFDIRASHTRQLAPSMGGSLVAAGAGLSAGIPASMAGAAAGPVGSWVAGRGAGMLAAGTAMFYNTKYNFEKEVYGSLNNYSKATRGREVSDDEWEKFSEKVKGKTNAYALHEAAWEAVGDVFGFDIIRYAPGARKAATSALAKAVAKPMQNMFARLGLKYTALQGEEMFTEVLTGKGQGKIEHSLGMRATEPTYGEVFREIAPATLAQTTLMAGAAGGISKAYDGAKTSFDKYVISRDADAMEVAGVVDKLDAAPLYRTGPTAGIPMQPTVPTPGPAQEAPLGPPPEFTGQIAQDERDAVVAQAKRDASFQAEIDKVEHGVTKGIERGQAESPFADTKAREQSKLDDEEIVFASLEDDLAASQPRGTGIDGEGEFFSFGSNWPEHLRKKGYDKATILQAIKKQRILRRKEASGEEIKNGDFLTERQQSMLDGAVDGKKEAFQYEEDAARQQEADNRLMAEEETRKADAAFEAFMADDLPEALIDAAAHEAATSPTNDTPEPTQAQKEAGNYKMGQVKVSGMDISVENPKGSVRKGSDEDGKAWETEMKSHYGYIKGTVGYDKDHLDVFLTDDAETAETAFIIDQINPKTGKFDEHKVVIGPKSEDEALVAYNGNYEDGWQGAAGVTQMPMTEFKEWSQGKGPSKGRLSEVPVTKLPQRPEILTQKYVDEKYKALLAEPVEDAPDNLSDSFDPSEFGEEDILKELNNSDNVSLTKQSLRAHIADRVGDMLETSRYESKQEGQEYEGRIDGLLKTVEGYRREIKPEIALVKTEQKQEAAPSTGLTITDHGKKSIIVTGVISANTDQIKAIGGATWNKKAQGWQFDKKNENKVRTALDELVAPVKEAAATPIPKKPAYGAKNTLVSADRYAEIQKKLREKLNARASVGFDPELAMLGMEAAAYHVEAGARNFTDYVKKMIADFGEGAKPYLKAWYTTARNFPGLNNEGMNTEAELDKVNIDVILEDTGDTENVINKRSDTDLERDLQAGELEDPMGEEGVRPELQSDGRPGESGVPETDEARSPTPGSLGATGHEAAPSGKRSDKSFYPDERKPRIAPGTAGSHDGSGSSNAGIKGLPPDTLPTETVIGTATPSPSLKEKIKLQADAKNVKIVPGNRANITESLPFLHTGQLNDVAFAETRFLKPKGYGVMFTNSTGTGKTYSGLGVVKRYERQGKTNILIAVPDVKVLNDWIDSGKNLGLKITKLEDINDAGTGIVATTYSNLGQNDALAKRNWDLVIADESHKLMQSQSGKSTLALETLRAITNHPDGRYAKYGMLYRKEINAVARLRKRKAEAIKKDKIQARIDAANKKLNAARAKVFAQVDAAQGAGRTRAMFLSATPFAYEKTVQYAEGYLFDFPEAGYIGNSRQGGYEKFMVEHFGYEIKYHRLQQPPAEVNRGFMQREFNSWLKKEKVLSGRMLDVGKDYDRKFILTENAIGVKIDEGLQFLFDNPQFEAVRTVIANKFDYLSRRYLLEAIKAREVLPLVKDHMAQRRKVVVFHDYKKGGGFNPFDVSYLQHSEQEVTNPENDKATTLGAVVTEFMVARPDLVNLDLSGMVSPIELFRKTFTEGENLLVVNGDESQKDNLAAYKKFNDDKTRPQVLLIQSAKNAGWSGHDTTGKHQRTLFNLGLPTQPTMSIQQEGRIYRIGQASNAMFRYLNTGTNWERMAFATTIAERSSAAENLALGEEARALMDSFIDGFEASDSYPAGHEGEGTGGKERDQAAAGVLSEWDRAQTMYWAQTKKTSRTKATEGKDYFATPEPLGLKMVEWADIQSGDKVLEPSAGHGAIARWFPENVDRTVIEPSSGLASRLKMVTDAKLLQHNFEDLHVVNKYNAIVMNPPFGSGGSGAIKHLKKATEHLRAGGRVVALIPQGPAANKKFDKFLYAEDEKGRSLTPDLHLVASIALPQSTFTRAGTKVATRVVIIDKIATDEAPQYTGRDYTDAGTPKELFERLEGAEVTGRSVSAPIVFTRRTTSTTKATKPMVALQVERVIKSLDLKNAPPVVVVKTETEYPQNVLRKINAEDAQGQVPAVYDPATQTVYIAADQVRSASEVRDYVLHEVTGHFGLRGLLGDKLDWVLDRVADYYGDAGLTDLAKTYGLDLTDPAQRRQAAEEKLAFMQQDDSVRGRSFWKKIYAQIRELLRRLGFIQKMNDTDIAKLLNDAYAFARDGQATRQRGAPVFTKLGAASDVITEHFDTSTATPISKFHDKMADTTKHWRTRFLDRLNPILDAGKKAGVTPEENIAYKLARMMGNTPAILATFLKHGRLAWDGQALKVFEKGKGFLPWFKSLGDDGMNALYWMSTKRAEILEGEGRENWLTKPVRDKIRSQIFKGLTAEQIEAKEKKFQAINDKIQAFNKNILDIAQEAGLISAENRALWMSDYYLPFYRIIEDDTTREEFLKSPRKSKKHISAMIKRLKGGEAKLGDPLSNMFQNWAHLINESQRNVARAEAFEMLKDTGIVEKLSKGDLIKILGASQVKEYAVVKAGNSKATTVFDTLDEAQEFIDRQESNSYAIEPRKTNTVMMGRKEDQGVLSFQKNGQTVNFKVNDPELFNALAEADIKFLQSSLMQMFGGAKRLLTYGATFGAGFRIANTLRDSISTAIVSKSFIPIMDSMTGFMKVLRNHPEYIALMSSGSGFSGSGYLTGDAKALSEQVKKLSKADRMRLIDSPKKLLELWEHLGHASEMAARVQAYHRLQEKGATHLEAAFKAKDLLDFGMRGNAATVQLLTQMIPFVNARFQGLYKLGRAAKENPADFLLKGGMLTTISLILWGMNKDDDRYKELEDWERFAYHHFWIGDDHYRLPKAFELGALFSSLPETIADTLAGNEEGEHVMNFIVHTLRETFALDAPQLVKPLTEVWANKSSFTGRSIVPMGLQRLPAGQQADPWTSESLKALGAKLNISPKKAEHLVRGYMAILGTTLLTATDIAYTLVTEQDLPEGVKLAMEGGQIPGWSRFARGADAPRYTKQESKFREAWVETEKTMALVNHYRRTGDLEAAQDLVSSKKRMLVYRQYLKQYTKALQKIRKAQQAAWYSTTLSTKEKHKIMDQLNEKKRVIMKRAAELAKKAE